MAPDKLAISFSREEWRRTSSSAKVSTWRISPTTRESGAAITVRASKAEARAASTAPIARPTIKRRNVSGDAGRKEGLTGTFDTSEIDTKIGMKMGAPAYANLLDRGA
ncbi:hypothetical protein ABID58_007297 [Bradyrhizobium sp. S3.2.6]